MPRTNKQGNMVMTEEEARQQLEAMGMEPPSKGKSKSKSKSQTNKQSGSPVQTTTSKGKGQGWWDEPLRHALSAHGIQTAMSGKDKLDDFGSVYYPSDGFKKGLKKVHGEVKAESLKEIIKELYHDPSLFEKLDEEVKSWINSKIGNVFARYDSQKSRNQLDNGNFKCPEGDYELLKEFENGLRQDISAVKTWREEMKSEHQNEISEYERKLRDYESRVKSKTDNPEKYRKLVNEKMSEYQFELNQNKADLEYADKLLDSLEQSHDEVKELYEKATIDKGGMT